jgi:hypothetical protein
VILDPGCQIVASLKKSPTCSKSCPAFPMWAMPMPPSAEQPNLAPIWRPCKPGPGLWIHTPASGAGLTCTPGRKISFLSYNYSATDLTRTDVYSETETVSLTSNCVSKSQGERKHEQGTSSGLYCSSQEFKGWSRWSVSCWPFFVCLFNECHSMEIKLGQYCTVVRCHMAFSGVFGTVTAMPTRQPWVTWQTDNLFISQQDSLSIKT